jgi:hypothetical protein
MPLRQPMRRIGQVVGSVNALCEARMWSARREIERHADAILF